MKFGKYFEPMLLKEVSKPFDDEDSLFEIKFDGIRATIHVSPDEIHVFSRNGTNLLNTFPELKNICSLVKRKTIFDGEIVAFKDGHPSFSTLQKRNLLKNNSKIAELMKEIPIIFVAFDCLYDDKPLIDKTLLERKKILDRYEENDYFVKTSYTLKSGKSFFKKVCSKGLEGMVAKKLDSKYYPNTRSDEWLKIKNFKTETFYIGGFIDNKIKSSLILGEYHNNSFHFVGKVAIERRSELYTKILASKRQSASPFADFNEKGIFYLSPKLTCPVTYIERTDSNNLRQPVLKK